MGALIAAIHDHGPITEENVGSAVKRVIGQLETEAERGYKVALVGDEHARCRAAIRCDCGEPGCIGWAMGHQWEDALFEDAQRQRCQPSSP